MAWTTPRTWVAGETVTAALFNTHIKNNLAALADTPHEVWLRRTSVFTNPNNTYVTVTWQTADKNVGGMWSSGSTVTIQRLGVYAVSAGAQWANTNLNGCNVCIRRNGTQVVANGDYLGANDPIVNKSASVTMTLSAADTIDVQVWQNGGVDCDVQSDSGTGTYLKVVEVKRRV